MFEVSELVEQQPPSSTDDVIVIGGRPVWRHLRDAADLSDRIAERVVGSLPAGASAATARRDAAVRTVIGTSLSIACSSTGEWNTQQALDRLVEPAEEWARHGVPIHLLNHAAHDGAQLFLRQVASTGTARDREALGEFCRRLVLALIRVSATMSSVYSRECSLPGGDDRRVLRALAAALLGDRAHVAVLGKCGVKVADSYTVLALTFRSSTDRARRDRTDHATAVRVETALLARGRDILPLVDAAGGIALVPVPAAGAALDTLIEQVSAAAGIAITAAAVDAPTAELGMAAEQARRLLDLVERRQEPPGLHRLDTLVVEHQLLQPGRARNSLASLLTPLADYPELVETLRAYCANDFNKKRTARRLHIHMNTLQHRFKRIGALTACDPSNYRGVQYLRAALIVGDAERADAVAGRR